MSRLCHLEQGQKCASKTPGLGEKAVYDVDIKFGLKVLGHQGMGLLRWPLLGMDGVCHLEQGPLGQPWTGAPRVVQKPFMMWTLNM